MNSEFKTVLWFAKQEGKDTSYSAALQCLERNGIQPQRCNQRNLPYHEGQFRRLDGTLVKIVLMPLIGKNSDLARSVAEKAEAIILSGTCSGRRGVVKIGDVIGVTGCYHIDRGAKHTMDGKVEYDVRPVYATAAGISLLTLLKEAKLEHSKTPYISIETRRDWVLDYLSKADKPLPQKELFAIASDEEADTEIRGKQWKKCVTWLKDNGFISIEKGQVELMQKGRDHCASNTLEGFAETSLRANFHLGSIVTSVGSHGDLHGKDSWNKFDTPLLSSIIGLDNDAYDMFTDYPKAMVIKAVKNFACEDKGDKTDALQKASTDAVMHVISHL